MKQIKKILRFTTTMYFIVHFITYRFALRVGGKNSFLESKKYQIDESFSLTETYWSAIGTLYVPISIFSLLYFIFLGFEINLNPVLEFLISVPFFMYLIISFVYTILFINEDFCSRLFANLILEYENGNRNFENDKKIVRIYYLLGLLSWLLIGLFYFFYWS